ncbi:MAG: PhzF family phenazine biosynthesis protein [Sphingomonas sp.]|nr:PhzF family phenazine biosynthesis protein [Sphingomonas sp.]
MGGFSFETVDVFTDRRFGGNPLAVFTDARGLDPAMMQAIAAEMNLSETAFVLPPENAVNDARVRIFNRSAEMPFAAHPSIGAACVLARQREHRGDRLRLEVPAGVVEAVLEREGGLVTGAAIAAPQPLTTGETIEPAAIAGCIGLPTDAVLTDRHLPIEISVGVGFVAAELRPDMMVAAVPDIARFRSVRAAMTGDGDRLSLIVYARAGDQLHARMFAPLAGTPEDPATGSANAALAALMLSLDGGDSARFTSRQGIEMGRPSTLRLTAARTSVGITATVAGGCVPMFTGSFDPQTTG